MTNMHPLDHATALGGAPGDPMRTARTSDTYWTFISPFGGASAATALRSVLERPERNGDPIALTVNFCAPIERGEFSVATRLVRANRSSQHWSVEFTQQGSDEAVLTASIVTAVRRATWSHQVVVPPAFLPAWDDLAPFANGDALPWVAQYEFRFAETTDERSETTFDPPRSPRSVLWIKDAEPRPLDFVSLAALSDAFLGRIFQVIGRIPPFGTVSMTTYFHASADELEAHGVAPLAAVADARVFHRSFGDQTVELFGAGGQLLATAAQLAYFRV
ncbi:MAG: thioesterase family protein [Caldimonas sp.]